MKKSSMFVILSVGVVLINPIMVSATSGKLKSDSIVTCNGVTYGRHGDDNHWHVAEKKSSGYYPNGSAIYSNPCMSNNTNNNSNSNNNSSGSSNTSSSSNNNSSNSNSQNQKPSPTPTPAPVIKEEVKSSDNTLKKVVINQKEFIDLNNLNYTTKEASVSIIATVNHEKASYEVMNNNLVIGLNTIIIRVKAEDGSVRDYNVYITRERILSSDKNVEVIIDGEKIEFKNNRADISVTHDVENVVMNYTLSDKNAKIEVTKADVLKIGENTIVLKVTAEDGSEALYQIVINKTSQTEEAISTVVGLGILGGMGYGTVVGVKKAKKSIKTKLLKSKK